METSKLIESESITVSASLKRQGDDENSEIEKKKPKMKSTRKLPISDLQSVIDNHKYSLQYDPEDYMMSCGSDYWVFQPEEHYDYKKGVRYTVRRKMKGKCGWGWRCDYYCRKCKKCSHQLECNCEGGKERNMCEHIHFVGRLLKKQDGEEDQDAEEDESEDEEGDEENEDEEEDDSTEEVDEDQESEDEEDNYETDQRNASSMTSEVEVLLQKVRDFVTGKKNVDIIIPNLKSTIALLEQNKK